VQISVIAIVHTFRVYPKSSFNTRCVCVCSSTSETFAYFYTLDSQATYDLIKNNHAYSQAYTINGTQSYYVPPTTKEESSKQHQFKMCTLSL